MSFFWGNKIGFPWLNFSVESTKNIFLCRVYINLLTWRVCCNFFIWNITILIVLEPDLLIQKHVITVILLLNLSGLYSKNSVGRLILTHLLKKWVEVSSLGFVGFCGASEDCQITICEICQRIFSDHYNETNSDLACMCSCFSVPFPWKIWFRIQCFWINLYVHLEAQVK